MGAKVTYFPHGLEFANLLGTGCLMVHLLMYSSDSISAHFNSPADFHSSPGEVPRASVLSLF